MIFKKNKLLNNVLMLVLVSTISYVLLFPVIVGIFTSFKPTSEVITLTPTLIPKHWTLVHYKALFATGEYPTYLFNGLFVAFFTTIATIMLASLAAVAIVWMKVPAKKQILQLILFTYMFPRILIIVPLFMMLYKLNLIDNKFGVVLSYLCFTLPFGIWMLKGFFESIPSDILDAARIDGCSYFSALRKVIIPVTLPAMAAVGTFSFILGWSEYIFASIIITSNSNRTITLGLYTLMGYYRTDYGLLTAACVIMIIPIVIFFIYIQKYLVSGLTAGTTKA